MKAGMSQGDGRGSGALRSVWLTSSLLAVGVVGWEHFLHVYGLNESDTLLENGLHIFRDSLMIFPLAFLATAAGLWLARRLFLSSAWSRAALVSFALGIMIVPAVPLHEAIDGIWAPGVSGAIHSHGQDDERPESSNLTGWAVHGLRDALAGQTLAFPLAAAGLAARRRREPFSGASGLSRGGQHP